MPFNRHTDSIAVTIPQFTLKKASLGAGLSPLLELWPDGIYNEPYFISLAIDASGVDQQSLVFNFTEYPNVRKGDTVEMLGDGSLVYGPQNPGSFVAVSIAFLEMDRDVQQMGKVLTEVIHSRATELGVKALLAAKPAAGAIVHILKELMSLVSTKIARNADDLLFRTEGIFLRDRRVPFDINRQLERGNDFLDMSLKVIPLDSSNKQGPEPGSIVLD